MAESVGSGEVAGAGDFLLADFARAGDMERLDAVRVIAGAAAVGQMQKKQIPFGNDGKKCRSEGNN